MKLFLRLKLEMYIMLVAIFWKSLMIILIKSKFMKVIVQEIVARFMHMCI